MPQIRNTPQRKILESLLQEATTPLLPKELLEQAQQQLPNLGIATVFRALKELVENGNARVVDIPGDSPRYESIKQDHAHHHHFKCDKCQAVYCLDGCPGNLESLLQPGFTLAGHDITLFGTCRNCNGQGLSR